MHKQQETLSMIKVQRHNWRTKENMNSEPQKRQNNEDRTKEGTRFLATKNGG